MSDIKPKLILRTGPSINEKSPSPSTKLLLNHGKPNFTINRSKSRTDQQTPPAVPEASQAVLKSTTFNGFVKPSTLDLSTENEVNKVVLRPTKLPEANGKPAQNGELDYLKVLRRVRVPETNGKPVADDEPEFIKAQRKIAERLAKENNLDFESRKSGYFTHVMMSPTSPSKPMELPVIESAKIQKATVLEVSDIPDAAPVEEPAQASVVEEPKPVIEAQPVETPAQNGHEEKEEEAVPTEPEPQQEAEAEPVPEPEPEVVQVAKTLVEEVVQSVPEEIIAQNGHSEENGHDSSPNNGEVNFEPKTITSFSKDLSSEPNNYPDTVKVTETVAPNEKDLELLQEMSKLKFDITADSEDVKVTPVLKAE